jgi:hypothetical protein
MLFSPGRPVRVQLTTDSHTVRKLGYKRQPWGRYKAYGLRLDEREWEWGTSTDRGARAQRQEDQNPEKTGTQQQRPTTMMIIVKVKK